MKQKVLLFIISLIIIVAPIFVFTTSTFAQTTSGGTQGVGLVPCGGPTQDPCKVKDVFVLVARVINTLIGLAGIYAVYVIIGAGFWMIVTMGNEESIAKQKKTLANAVVGLVFTMMAYMFINTAVNYILIGQAGKTIIVNGKQEKCSLDLQDPLNYLYIHSDPTRHSNCAKAK